MRGRALCPTYNGHSTGKLEKAILEYLAQFSDAEAVRQHLEAAEREELERSDADLEQVTNALADIDGQFLKHLDYLKKDLLNEEEFEKANVSLRGQKAALETRQIELTDWRDKQRDKAEASERIPKAIGSFIEDFQGMDIQKQKAQLQTILKAANVHRDGHIELEFRA